MMETLLDISRGQTFAKMSPRKSSFINPITGLPSVPYFPYLAKCPVFVPYLSLILIVCPVYPVFSIKFSLELEAIDKKIKELK